MLRTGEIVVDNFAGGGGASTGIRLATGMDVDVAINHSPEAVAMHRRNHPHAAHLCQNVWQADPTEVAAGRPVGLAWFSPDCRHFSKAKGGAPVSPRVRDLAWVVVLWARVVKPRVIMLENVEEFRTWGPLLEDGKPCPARQGTTFRKWVRELEREGYRVEWKELRACDYGAPTIRKRLFVIARRDGLPIVWPAPTHGLGTGRPWRTAAECIDWTIPCPSIFGRGKDLADATLRRIAHGVMRYVVNAERPFIVNLTHGTRLENLDAPFNTITAAPRGEKALMVPHITKFRSNSVGHGADEPMHTITANGHSKRPGGCAPMGLVSAVLTGCGGRAGQSPPRSVEQPFGTLTTKADGILVTPRVAAFLAQHNGGAVARSADDPMATITTAGSQVQPVVCELSDEDLEGAQRVTAFLVKYYGTAIGQAANVPLDTITTKGRFGLVTCQGYPITDIGMRMLHPKELFAAQGFPADYEIASGLDESGEPVPLTKTAQVRLVGNSVCPPLDEALVRANLGEALEQGEVLVA